MVRATHGGSSYGRCPDQYSGGVHGGGARHLLDEMPSHREATPGGVLRVTVSHVLYPVNEEVLHQVFDAYGAEQVVVLQRADHVDVLVRFRLGHDAERARDATHGRCIYEGCCWLDVHCMQPNPSDSVVATPATCSTLGSSHDTDVPMAASTPAAALTTSTTSAAATTTSLATGAREALGDKSKELAPKAALEEPKKTVQLLCEQILATLNHMIEGGRDANLNTTSNAVEPTGHSMVSSPTRTTIVKLSDIIVSSPASPAATVKWSDIIISHPVPLVIADSVLDQDSAAHKVLEERSDMSMMAPWPPPTQGQLIKELLVENSSNLRTTVLVDGLFTSRVKEQHITWDPGGDTVQFGSGHEPAHAGFVRPGMLTAAVSGDVFASPHVDSILAAIRAVTGPMGCLLIVKNYTGDRLNFGLAAKQAKSEGYKMEMVIVGDNCALAPPRGIVGRRGSAGTILVHKVARATADAGLSLADVAVEAKHASEVVGTMGVALFVCTLPGQVTSNRLGPKQMELGLGIHGEPGVAVVELQPVDVVVEHALKQILSQETQYLPNTRGSNAVLLINGLGATPIMELMIAARKAVPELQLEYGIAVDRVYTGTFMSSLDMAGFSITIMRSDETILQRLDAPAKAPAWPVGSEGNRPPAKIPVPVPPSPSMKDDEILSQPQELSKQGCILEAAIEAVAKEIINLKDTLNEWDSKVGDGDCGTTMHRGATAILEDMKKRYPMNDAAGTINEIGATVRRVMGGTSGILYDILCKAAYASLKQNTTITANEWADALESSVAAVSKYGGASAGYRTMLDALTPASTVLKQSLKAGNDPVTAFIASSEAASAGAESTKQMQAKAGRSSYIAPDLLASVPDPGAMAAAAWYRAAALSVKKQLHASES